jgi:transcriptional regulator
MSDADGITGVQVPLFERFGDADVRALVEGYPLAWVCGGAAAALETSQLPLIGSNPLHAALSDDPRAKILFSGPQTYVSPEHARRRNWAPTWNYAQLTIGAEIAFDSDLTEYALKVLIDAMEAGRAAPWGVEELGPRYDGMLERIIGFRARVTRVSGKFKLGQDEDDTTLGAILDALPDGDMTAWMRRFNPGR